MATHPADAPGGDGAALYDLPAIARAALGKKPAWTQQTDDLNLNLISCIAGQGVDRHVNSELDVLVVGISGEGFVEVDGHWHSLQLGQAVVIPKGASRATRCDRDHFAYLTCHRRRSGLWPQPQRRDDVGRQ